MKKKRKKGTQAQPSVCEGCGLEAPLYAVGRRKDKRWLCKTCRSLHEATARLGKAVSNEVKRVIREDPMALVAATFKVAATAASVAQDVMGEKPVPVSVQPGEKEYVVGEKIPDDKVLRVGCTKCKEVVTLAGKECRGIVTCQKCGNKLGTFDTEGRRVA